MSILFRPLKNVNVTSYIIFLIILTPHNLNFIYLGHQSSKKNNPSSSSGSACLLDFGRFLIYDNLIILFL